MAITLYDAINEDGVFNVQGKAFFAQDTINTARLTTMPAQILDVYDVFNNLTVDADLEVVVSRVGNAADTIKSTASAEMSQLKTFSQGILVEMIDDDNPQPDKTLNTALVELIAQMEASSDSVDASTVSISVAVGSANTGDGIILTSIRRGDGLIQENIIAENIEVLATSNGLSASLLFAGEARVSLLDALWPKGSGVGRSVGSVDAAASLLLNGDMEDEDDVTDTPDDWDVSVGTIGTGIKMTDVEIQTVVMSGTPTAGHYLLHFTNTDGKVQTTNPIAFDATSSTVASELNKLTGLALITVVQTGTSPDFTHTITFTGKGGNLTQLTSTDNTTGGSIAHATTTQGTTEVFSGGKAVQFNSNNTELITLNQRLTGLKSETSYAVSLWAIADITPAAGVISIDLVDGIGGTLISDKQGAQNSLSFNASDLTQAWKHLDTLVAALNESQKITITGTPTGGTFTLSFDGQTTGTISYNASSGTVQSALEALSNVEVGDVSATGGALPGTAVDIEFTGLLASSNVPQMTADDALLTGGTTPTVTITTTTEGSSNELAFRTPTVVPDVVYLRLRISTVVSAGTLVFIDHVALAEFTEIYAGGPLVSVFSGATEFKIEDVWTVTTTNDRAGQIQEAYNRNFNMVQLGLLLPSNTIGTIPDSVIG